MGEGAWACLWWKGRGSCEWGGLMSDMFDFCPYSVSKKGYLERSLGFLLTACN